MISRLFLSLMFLGWGSWQGNVVKGENCAFLFAVVALYIVLCVGKCWLLAFWGCFTAYQLYLPLVYYLDSLFGNVGGID